MSVSFEAIAILLFLLPGFLSSTILNAITVRKDKDNLSRICEALAFASVTYGISHLLVGGVRTGVPTAASPILVLSRGQIIVVMAASIVLPLLLGFSITHDLHMRLLRKLYITNKTARETVWFDVFTDIGNRYVVANLTDGRRILGWPQYYSNTPEEGMLYLHAPSWIDEKGNNVPMQRHGILLSKAIVQSVEFAEEESE